MQQMCCIVVLSLFIYEVILRCCVWLICFKRLGDGLQHTITCKTVDERVGSRGLLL
jgi:hypothetical protein